MALELATEGSSDLGFLRRKRSWARRESNPHARRQQGLSPLCLPFHHAPGGPVWQVTAAPGATSVHMWVRPAGRWARPVDTDHLQDRPADPDEDDSPQQVHTGTDRGAAMAGTQPPATDTW